ncbi:MAG TPA: NAD(P)/FAD-dependent oxidoreductase [Polyangia bacterium]|jgi:NADPH-dependent 2,4-dienoyl-CoA reductase/sulfur reductase-like enzyme|nr:NAD(P)/FAD-dependent oxidoreductase [Polyangia bacterium]
MKQRILIIGNGVAGITAAFTVRERDSRAEITVISGESDFFFSRTALMYAFMDKLDRRDLEPYERKVYGRQNIQLVRAWVQDLDAERHMVKLDDGRELTYDRLLLATGAGPNRFPVPLPGLAEVRQGLVNFVSLGDLDACEALTPSTRQAVVVGGGLIGIELVECLVHHGVKVTFLVREPWFFPLALGREEGTMLTDAMRRHHIDVRLSDELASVERDGDGRVSGVVTKAGERILCQMLGLCIGVRPNKDWLEKVTTPPKLGRGIIVDPQLRTSLPDVWSAGDCAEIHYPDHSPLPRWVRNPLIEQIWYSAKRQGALAGHNMSMKGKPAAGLTYTPPIYFNSAKFLDIEYTTVGETLFAPEGSRVLYRRHPRRAISQTIVSHESRVLGFNMLGSRWDHAVLTRWVEEGRDIDWVREHLREAQYDVEFGRLDLGALQEEERAYTPLPADVQAMLGIRKPTNSAAPTSAAADPPGGRP